MPHPECGAGFQAVSDTDEMPVPLLSSRMAAGVQSSRRGRLDRTMKPLYPLLLDPVYKDYIWGGNLIPRRYGRDLPDGIYAESWEVTDRPEGMSRIVNGPLAGASLHDLISDLGASLLGVKSASAAFPLLIKIIDAGKRLSVQVHPNDRTALTTGGQPKTETWYVLDAEPNARVFAGLVPGTSADTFLEALHAGTVEDCLVSLPIEPGMVIFIPGGRVHAIGEGALLLEVQQNSNTTYRVYDWGRSGQDGKPRPLHIDQALQVINWEDRESPCISPVRLEASDSLERWELVRSPYFKLERINISSANKFMNDGAGFQVLFTADSHVHVEGGGHEQDLGPGTSCLLPAALEAYSLEPLSGQASVIRISE